MRYPLLLSPAFKDYLWGGERLKTEYHKQTDLTPLAESWELSCHPDGNSRVKNGSFQGMALAEVVAQHPDFVGAGFSKGEDFPLLIKLIDAKDRLSVQVHPDDEYGRRVEHSAGKTEMWYIVDCDPGATLIYGFKKALTRQELRERIESNTLMEAVNEVPVHKGDVFFIEATTLHAIGKGILIAEIQQNSNVTYRVYDYGRKDAAGRPRPLHIDKAVEVVDRRPAAPPKVSRPSLRHEGAEETLLQTCRYFTVRHVRLSGGADFSVGAESFRHLLILDGRGELRWQGEPVPFGKGDSLFLPAGLGGYRLEGNAAFLLTAAGPEEA